MKSVMELSDSSAIAQAIAKIRGFIIPMGLNSNPELLIKTVKEARLRLAEYNYENIKVRLNKRTGSVKEDELRQCQSDVTNAGLAMFK